MNTRQSVALAVALLSLLLINGAVAGDGNPTVDWWVIGGGGGHSEVPPFRLDGTIGQPVVGMDGVGPCGLCSGFWCEAWGRHRVHLPLVIRQAP
jgi:hypothetical protein